MAYQNQGFAVMDKVADLLSDVAQVDKPAQKVEGRNMVDLFLVEK